MFGKRRRGGIFCKTQLMPNKEILLKSATPMKMNNEIWLGTKK